MVTQRVHAFPACDGVGPDHRVDSFKDLAHVLGCTTRLREDLEIVLLRRLVEARLSEVCIECLEEALEGLGDPLIQFVAGGPKRILILRQYLINMYEIEALATYLLRSLGAVSGGAARSR
jgi:hypothetical protein